jgi:hypothetical protein
MTLEEFAGVLGGTIAAKRKTGASAEAAFVAAAAELGEEHGILENVSGLEGFGRNGKSEIHGYTLDETSEEAVALSWVSVEPSEFGQPVPDETIMALGDESGKILEQLRDAGPRLLGGRAPDDNVALASEWQRALQNDRVEQFRQTILTKGRSNITFYQPPAEIFGGLEAAVEVLDLQRLHELIVSRLPYVAHRTDFQQEMGRRIEVHKVPLSNADYDAYMLLLTGNDLASLYQRHGQSLLEMNVRAYLELKSKVNKGIHETILTSPSRFFAYNNGLTMTAESIEMADGKMTAAVGLQIVNGGQTVVTVHRAFVGNAGKARENVGQLFVQAKLVVPKSKRIAGEISSLVSKYANTQNKVTDADFTANDRLNVSLEEVSRKVKDDIRGDGWYYERHKGDYQAEIVRIRDTEGESAAEKFRTVFPPEQVLSKTDIARIWMSWLALPHVACLGSQKCFVRFIEHCRSRRNWSPEVTPKGYKSLIGLYLIDKEAQKMSRELDIASYRSSISAYAMALLGQKTMYRIDPSSIYLEGKLPPDIRRTLRNWIPILFRQTKLAAGDRNHGEYLKKEHAWIDVLRSSEYRLDHALETSIGQATPDATVGGVATENLEQQMLRAKIMAVPVDVFVEISKRGDAEEWLYYKQLGILDTITRYARGGWRHVPSGPQVASMGTILKAAEQHGISIPIERIV